jgi:hypothetical protein
MGNEVGRTEGLVLGWMLGLNEGKRLGWKDG